MKVIGITGGVGAGKTELLSCIALKYDCKVILADEAAHRVKEPGEAAYDKLVKLLSPDILDESGRIHRGKMAEKIFASKELLQKVNDIIHPAVKELLLKEIATARRENRPACLFIEAALLIEEGYGALVDEMWYIYAREDIRRSRLKKARGYSDEKIDAIMRAQLTEDKFRNACSVVIDNSGSLAESCRQVDEQLMKDKNY